MYGKTLEGDVPHTHTATTNVTRHTTYTVKLTILKDKLSAGVGGAFGVERGGG
jgi:hypothetical protein